MQARQWQSFRVGLLDNLSIDDQRYWLTAAAEIGVPLAIVTGGDQVRALGRDYVHQAELWNEPDGTIDRYFEPARVPRARTGLCRRVRRGLGRPVACRKTLPSASVRTTTCTPSSGKRRTPAFSRASTRIEAFKVTIGQRPWIVTELGYRTTHQYSYPKLGWASWLVPNGTYRWTDLDTRRMFGQLDLHFWARHGCDALYWYQLLDGPAPTKEERFGILTVDADGVFTGWKPIADVLLDERLLRNRHTQPIPDGDGRGDGWRHERLSAAVSVGVARMENGTVLRSHFHVPGSCSEFASRVPGSGFFVRRSNTDQLTRSVAAYQVPLPLTELAVPDAF